MHSISDPVLTVSKPVCRGSAYACPCSLLKAFRVENCFKTVLRLETRERGRAHNQRLQQACDWFPFDFFFCFPFLIQEHIASLAMDQDVCFVTFTLEGCLNQGLNLKLTNVSQEKKKKVKVSFGVTGYTSFSVMPLIQSDFICQTLGLRVLRQFIQCI